MRNKPQFNNPFPQIRTIAVLPFVNQSEEPTLSSERVTLAYINELQSIPGFEVLPMGAVKSRLAQANRLPECGEEFQALARELGVDAVLIGSIVDYTPYYPPRMTLKVNWYAANPGFHPILPGYGLPWGTKDEKKIPRWVQREAERALATEQLKTQTPDAAMPGIPTNSKNDSKEQPIENADRFEPVLPPSLMPEDQQDPQLIKPISAQEEIVLGTEQSTEIGSALAPAMDAPNGEGLPGDWPDARGFIPDAPSISRPPMLPQHDPIISHMQNYNGHDDDFTRRLEHYVYFRDDARFGGWQGYLQRSDDFIRVCCHFHITETLACRGGQEDSRLIVRWPIERFRR